MYHIILLSITVAQENIVLINPDTQYLTLLTVSLHNEYQFSLIEPQYMNNKSLFSYKLCV